MIEHELLLLGLLKEGPKHGYDIKLKVREILSLFAGVELSSVYYPLRVLEKNGLLAKHLNKFGRRPQRIVYCLTSKGEDRFNELLSKSLFDFKRPQFSLDLSLYFLHYVQPDFARRKLKTRLIILRRISNGLKQMFKSQNAKGAFSLSSILGHNLALLEAETGFLQGLIKRI
ncbi:MAG: PadR family transcriptional regulator [Candidatus Omnitrophota bacterium]|nr:PadR family transcriptional regulator [Candidatus Omnitrophota bacterium]